MDDGVFDGDYFLKAKRAQQPINVWKVVTCDSTFYDTANFTTRFTPRIHAPSDNIKRNNTLNNRVKKGMKVYYLH